METEQQTSDSSTDTSQTMHYHSTPHQPSASTFSQQSTPQKHSTSALSPALPQMACTPCQHSFSQVSEQTCTTHTLHQPSASDGVHVLHYDETSTNKKALVPVTLFEGCNDAVGRSSELKEHEAVDIDCGIDSLVDMSDEAGLQTKASKLFQKIIGQEENLNRFDILRVKLKSLQKQKMKPTISDMEEYETLLAKLHSHLLCTKYTIKDKLRELEKTYIISEGGLHLNKLQSTKNFTRN